MERKPKHPILIAARAFAEKLATPTFIADNDGRLVYYNEAAESVLGRTFAEAGEMRASEWSAMFTVRGEDGTEVPLEEMPGGIALLQHRPAHGRIRITALDGIERRISVTGLPLFAKPGQAVGMVAYFWPEDGAG